MHIVQLIVQTRREAVVITGADNRVEDLRGARTLKGHDALTCEIRNANALCFDLAGLGKRYDQWFAKEQARLIGRTAIGRKWTREADVDLSAIEMQGLAR